MRLNTVIIADDSVSCDISALCVLLKDTSAQLLEQFEQTMTDVYVTTNTYCSDGIDKHTISEKLSVFNSNGFLCFWYGHGSEDTFNMNGEKIVSTTENHYIFSNALIYTFSCLNGNNLADVLIENNAKAFVGYTSNANCPYGIDDVTCNIAMSFVTSFLGGKSICSAVDDLRAAYEDAIFNDELEPFQRSRFQENRDGIVLKGNGALTINDLLVA